MAAAQVAEIKEEVLTFVSTALLRTQAAERWLPWITGTDCYLPWFITTTRHSLSQALCNASSTMDVKVRMFCSQFTLTTSEEHTVVFVTCVFFISLCSKVLLTPPLAVSAPQNYLHLLQVLINYTSINNYISRLTAQKAASHLGYLNEELVGLAVFQR